MTSQLNCILLIDDSKVDNYLHQTVIEEINAAKRIIIKKDGLSALDYLESNQKQKLPQPNLIFLDINSPDMSGWTFIEKYERLIEESTRSQMTVIMLSGSLDPEDAERAKAQSSIQKYETKPLTEEKLETIIRKFCSAN